MKYLLLFLTVLLAIGAVTVYSATQGKNFRPTEKIPADTAVSFPVDI